MRPARRLAHPRRAAAAAAGFLLVVMSGCGSGGGDDEGADALITAPSDTTALPAAESDHGPAVTSIEITEVDMPDLVGLSEEDAQAELADLGFPPVEVITEPSDEPVGSVIGQTPRPGRIVEPGETEVVLTVAEQRPPEMPDVVGTDLDAAVSALEELDLNLTVTVEDVDSVMTEGEIIAQSPGSGTILDDDDTVELQVARATETPDFSELSDEDIEELLEALGGTAEFKREYTPGVTEEGFVRQRPQPGEPMTEEVTIVRGGPAAGLYLGRLRAVSRDYEFNSGNVRDINGQTYAHSLSWQPDPWSSCTGSDSIEYNLSREFDAFSAVIGYEDNAPTHARARVQVFTDGTKVFEQDYGLGEGDPVMIDVKDVLRLKITVVCLNGRPEIVFGEAQLLGAPEVIAEYESSGDDYDDWDDW